MKLRKTIQAAAPKATEEISYQVPTFKLLSRRTVPGETPTNRLREKSRWSPRRGSPPQRLQGRKPKTWTPRRPRRLRRVPGPLQLESYPVGKGSIRFPADKPLPAALVRKLVKARIAENEARARSRRA